MPDSIPRRRQPATPDDRVGERSRHGMSLAETVVGLLVLAAVAGLGFGGYGMAKARQAEADCLKNLRTWSGVIDSYSADHAGAVTIRDWARFDLPPGPVSPYLRYFPSRSDALAACRCPAEKQPPAGASLVCYAMVAPQGADLDENGAYSRLGLAQPGEVALLVESVAAPSPVLADAADLERLVAPVASGDGDRHQGKVHVLFHDGSITNLPFQPSTASDKSALILRKDRILRTEAP